MKAGLVAALVAALALPAAASAPARRLQPVQPHLRLSQLRNGTAANATVKAEEKPVVAAPVAAPVVQAAALKTVEKKEVVVEKKEEKKVEAKAVEKKEAKVEEKKVEKKVEAKAAAKKEEPAKAEAKAEPAAAKAEAEPAKAEAKAEPAKEAAPAEEEGPKGTPWMEEPMPLKAQEQGFHGKDVEHVDGETHTADWMSEYGHAPTTTQHSHIPVPGVPHIPGMPWSAGYRSTVSAGAVAVACVMFFGA